MIVRHILEDPEMSFDYFNDYEDTMRWLKGVSDSRATKAVKTLSKGYRKWHAAWRKVRQAGRRDFGTRDSE